MRKHNDCIRRSGFTLVELLIVIAIIGVLVALISGAALRFIGTQQYNNTITGLKLYNGKAVTQWGAVSNAANKDNSPAYDTWCTANGGVNRAGFIQAKLVQAFPVTFNEALNPGAGLTAWPAYQNFLGKLGISGSSANTQPIEASVCLIMALTSGPYNDGSTADSFGGANVATQTLGNGTTRGAVDGYGTPLGVVRTANGLVITSAGQDLILGTSDDMNTNNLP